jgi:hypothetical protein
MNYAQMREQARNMLHTWVTMETPCAKQNEIRLNNLICFGNWSEVWPERGE